MARSIRRKPRRKVRRQNLTKARIESAVSRFSALPDDAQIEIRVLSQLYSRSVASLWRDLAAGRLPTPMRIGNRCTRWRVGDIRASLRGSMS